MLVGVICDDRWHPAEIVREGVSGIGTDDVEWEFVLDTMAWKTADLDRFDAILLTKSNCRSKEDPSPWLDGEMQRAFVEYVERGRGLLVVHSGTVGYADEIVLRNLVGGVFVRHPEPCAVTIEVIGNSEVSGPDRPCFTVQDEHYIMQMFAIDRTVFMTSTSPHGVQPAGWTRRQGRGRVCVLTPGHTRDVWTHPEYRRLLTRAVDWCVKGDSQ